MRKTWTLAITVMLVLSACGTQPSPTATSAPRQVEPTPTARPATAPAQTTPPSSKPPAGRPLPTERGEFFAASGVCTVCHTNMVDAAGADVSLDSAWRSTLMANSTRDPYWQASFRSEVLKHPDYQETIEDKCTTCHAPMAHFTAAAHGEKGKGLDDGFFNPANPLHTLAVDGISCTLCHQISGSNLDQPDSHSGAFVIDADLPAGQRVTYGPFPVVASQAAIMQGSSGFVPQESQHIQQSELCAVCHTLYTPYLDAAGQIAGEFAEQTVYLEWHDSDYRDTRSCQSCHMPQAQGGVVLSVTGGEPRSPVLQHVFVGGNTYVLSMLLQFGEEMETTASMGHFSATLQRLLDQLQNHSATLTIEQVNLSDGRLSAAVVVENQAGHKLPTSYPSRRAWLHFTVRDADGAVIFESGAYNADGSIVGNDNDDDAASYEPHYLAIDSPDQVQIYEAIMGNSDGEVTTTLLRGASYMKDNRLLPSGFETVDPDIAVNGQAAEDLDFRGGGDRVQYDVPLAPGSAGGPNPPGPFSVTVELLYQPISYRWIDNLRQYSAPEIDRFLAYEQVVPNWPIVIARATVEVTE
jgi:hypothetical protein